MHNFAKMRVGYSIVYTYLTVVNIITKKVALGGIGCIIKRTR